jgi:hypothetical protein
MPTFTVETPDGRKLDIEADDERGAIAGAQDWVIKNPAKSPDVAVDMAKGFGYGANTGIDDMLNVIGSPIRVPINEAARLMGYEGELIPQLDLAKRANVAGPAETEAGRYAQATGEVAGASAIPFGGALKAGKELGTRAPKMIQQMARNPGKAVTLEAASTTGAGTGIGYAREEELGPVAEVGLGLLGGFAAPNVANIGSRAYAAGKSAKNYTGRQMDRAGNPQLAADQDTVEVLAKAGIKPESLFDEFAPTPSATLKSQKNITNETMADMIGRSMRGEPVDQIAREYGIGEGTLRKYLREHKAARPTPRNVADVVQDRTNIGNAQPMLRLGRAAHGIANDAEATSKLTARQNDQYGRMGTIFSRAAKGRDYDATVSELDEALGAKSQTAYGRAHANEQSFDLRPALEVQRKAAHASAGEIRDTLNKAVDLFFEPLAVPKRISAMQNVRLKEMAERIAKAEAAPNPDLDRIAQLKRRFDGMRDDLEYEQNAKPEVHKIGKPIADVKRYQAAREALDQMIETSKHQGKATPLTRRLTVLRRSINSIVREANPLLAEADDQFSGAKSVQELLKRGEKLTTQLGSKTDEFFKDFKNLTPEQREIVRLSFLRNLANKAARPQEGAAVANQFRSPAVKQTIQRLFGPETVKKGATEAEKKAVAARNKENAKLGSELIRGGREEATTTNTLNQITNRGNTQTAPWARDMALMEEGAELVGDAMTMNWMGVLKKTGKKLANQIGERQAKAILDNLANTAPDEVIPKIRRWVQLAKTADERRAYVLTLKEFARVPRRFATDAGTVTTVGNE